MIQSSPALASVMTSAAMTPYSALPLRSLAYQVVLATSLPTAHLPRELRREEVVWRRLQGRVRVTGVQVEVARGDGRQVPQSWVNSVRAQSENPAIGSTLSLLPSSSPSPSTSWEMVVGRRTRVVRLGSRRDVVCGCGGVTVHDYWVEESLTYRGSHFHTFPTGGEGGEEEGRRVETSWSLARTKEGITWTLTKNVWAEVTSSTFSFSYFSSYSLSSSSFTAPFFSATSFYPSPFSFSSFNSNSSSTLPQVSGEQVELLITILVTAA